MAQNEIVPTQDALLRSIYRIQGQSEDAREATLGEAAVGATTEPPPTPDYILSLEEELSPEGPIEQEFQEIDV
mgnify:CR=1 FL=1|jgi:hypothetical protein